MSAEFIHVAEAKRLIKENIEALSSTKVSLKDAAGLILAEDIFSLTDVPPFDQSSMDGYALNFQGWQGFKDLIVDGEVQAGKVESIPMPPQNTRRIFTGAAVPPGADTVVIQEKVLLENGKLVIKDTNLIKGLNVRIQGSEAKAGELALEKSSLLTAAAVGFIAGLGIRELRVYPRPAVSIILTGNELQEPGKPLEHGQVYESNSYALIAALKQAGISDIKTFKSEDSLETLIKVLKEAMEQTDAVLLTGGVSVGEYDFVIRAANANRIEQIFHKIRQKPGKPLYFGKKEKKCIFGLPGNPASVLSCYYQYVLPALGVLSNRDTGLKQLKVPLAESLKKPLGLTQFLKGFFDGSKVRSLNAQESFRLSSFAKANCLIQLDADQSEYNEGDLVEINLLPSN